MKTVVTHNRQFNLDEIAAISLLKHFTKEEYKIIRTRDTKLLNQYKSDSEVFVLDVGTEYDPKKLNFDHHQKTMKMTWDGGIPYSSCGLVWKWLKEEGFLSELSGNQIMKFESSFIRKVDAQDNGLKIFPEMSFVTKSNRNHIDDAVLDKHFMKTLSVMDSQVEMITNNIKAGMKSPIIKTSKVTPYLDYLMTTSLMKNYYFTEDFNMRTENGELKFSYVDKHNDEKEFKFLLNKKQFTDIDGVTTDITGTLTEKAWDLIINNPKVSNKMNPQTIEMMEDKIVKHFGVGKDLPVDMSYLFMYEHAKASQKEGFKVVNGYVSNAFSEVRSELRNDKELKKFVKKSEGFDNIVLCDKNIRGGADKIKSLAPETTLMIVPRDKKSWKIQRLYESFSMPKEWLGLSEGALKKVSNDKRLIFCHKSGFMLMIACSKDEVVKFAKDLLSPSSPKNEVEKKPIELSNKKK